LYGRVTIPRGQQRDCHDDGVVNRTRVSYGPRHGQSADLWRPHLTTGRLPVVVLFHGGFWKGPYTKRLMNRLAADISGRGWAAFNVEYRRVGALGRGGGWPATFSDVAAALDALEPLPGLDLDRVITCGHSAGGQLALWGAARHRLPAGAPDIPIRVRPCAAISLAGVVDLVEAAETGLGGGAAAALLGGDPAEYPDRYQAASPAAMVPLGVPHLLVHGLADTTVPAAMSERYVAAAAAAGDDASYLPIPGAGHLDMIDPAGSGWGAATARLAHWL
jgi:acetyl esterase/lipase